MKHLKKYNEGKEESEDELMDFCETNLAYLLDDKISIRIPSARLVSYNSSEVVYHIQIDAIDRKDGVYWNDIKDYFIPFVQRLTSNYKLEGWGSISKDAIVITYKIGNNQVYTSKTKGFSCYDVINDNLDINQIWCISVKVEV